MQLVWGTQSLYSTYSYFFNNEYLAFWSLLWGTTRWYSTTRQVSWRNHQSVVLLKRAVLLFEKKGINLLFVLAELFSQTILPSHLVEIMVVAKLLPCRFQWLCMLCLISATPHGIQELGAAHASSLILWPDISARTLRSLGIMSGGCLSLVFLSAVEGYCGLATTSVDHSPTLEPYVSCPHAHLPGWARHSHGSD